MSVSAIKYGDGIAILIDKNTADKANLSVDGPINATVVGNTLMITTEGEPIDDAKFEQLLQEVNQQYGPMLQRLA